LQRTEDPLVFTHVFTKDNPGCIDSYYRMERDALGEGSYGRVTKGMHKSTRQLRAIKAIDVKKIPDMRRFHNEVAIQKMLDHPNIVKLYEVFKDAQRYYLVMELCTGGELFDRIVEEADKHEGQALTEASSAKIMLQIMGAIHYMHQKNFAHRDVKPENFLLQNRDREAPIKVIDFGLAKQFEPGRSDMKTKAGTPYYVAPEILLTSPSKGPKAPGHWQQGEPEGAKPAGDGYNEKCDVWSCGVLAYIILCGYPPFYGDRDSDILKMVKKGEFDFPNPDWDHMSGESKDFITQMLTFNPQARPTAGDMVEHPWLKTFDSRQDVRLPADFGANLKKFSNASKLKKVALTLMAQQMKEEDIEELKQTFAALDLNNNGTLSQAEIREGMKKHGQDITGLAETLEALDTDGSGEVDYTEFVAATLSARQYLKKEVLWAAFRVFDVNGSGEIDRDELKEVLQDDNVKQIDAMIKEVDLNGDGKISFEEFCTMMQTGP